MRKNLFKITSVLFLVFMSASSIAQNQVKTAPPAAIPQKVQQKPYVTSRSVDTVKNTDFTLDGQYRFLLSRSRSSYGSKLINPAKLASLWKSVNDTLKKERGELATAKIKITAQAKSINTLQSEISGKETSLNDTTAKANEINLLGMSFTKGTYNIIVWSIILILAISLFVVIARSAKNIMEAKQRTQLYEEISSEYQAYKVKSNEQQRKLARELQDERNVIEELKSKGK